MFRRGMKRLQSGRDRIPRVGANLPLLQTPTTNRNHAVRVDPCDLGVAILLRLRQQFTLAEFQKVSAIAVVAGVEGVCGDGESELG